MSTSRPATKDDTESPTGCSKVLRARRSSSHTRTAHIRVRGAKAPPAAAPAQTAQAAARGGTGFVVVVLLLFLLFQLGLGPLLRMGKKPRDVAFLLPCSGPCYYCYCYRHHHPSRRSCCCRYTCYRTRFSPSCFCCCYCYWNCRCHCHCHCHCHCYCNCYCCCW